MLTFTGIDNSVTEACKAFFRALEYRYGSGNAQADYQQHYSGYHPHRWAFTPGSLLIRRLNVSRTDREMSCWRPEGQAGFQRPASPPGGFDRRWS